MDSETIKKLDVHSLLKKTRVETTEQIVLSPTSSEVPKISQARDDTLDVEIEQLDSLTKQFNNPHVPKVICKQDLQERTVNEILDKYNKKYNLDLKYGNLQDALELAVEGDAVKSSLMNGVVGNSILSMVDYSNFLLILMICKSLNGVVNELLEGDNLSDEERLVLIDRLFTWSQKLQTVKAMYSPTDIAHLVKRVEQQNLRNKSDGSKVAINKILDILKLGQKKD